MDSEAAAAGRDALQRAEKAHEETAASRSAALDRQEADLKALDKTLLEREMDLKGLRSDLAAERARLDDQVRQVCSCFCFSGCLLPMGSATVQKCKFMDQRMRTC